MTVLNECRVVFDEERHTYELDGKRLSGITCVIERMLFPGQYSFVPKEVLDNAAARGHKVHSDCEFIDVYGAVPETEEGDSYEELVRRHGLVHVASEYLVSDMERYASSIDKVYEGSSEGLFVLADIKTTYKLYTDKVRWQLSIYAYLFELQNPHAKVEGLYAIWLRGCQRELVEIERIDDALIKKLLECYITGASFENPFAEEETDTSMPVCYGEISCAVEEIVRNAEYWTEQKKALQEGIMREMVKAGAYKWENDALCFTRRKDSTGKRFDTAAFKRDHPDLYEEYLKESTTVGGVALKVK